MKCLLLGEGPSDIGVNDDFQEPRFQKGPMTLVIDFLAAKKGVRRTDYGLLSRGDVSRGIKNQRRGVSARPKEVDPELRTVYQSAWYIGKMAVDEKRDVCVYFHDADRTNSEPHYQAQRLESAMGVGFALSGFQSGVPMIPVPRSEAWLLAYFQKGLAQQTAYNKSGRFEKLPANDNSPKSAKKLLQKAVGAQTEEETYPKVMEEFGNIDWTRVDMPSYNHFRECLESVLDAYNSMVESGADT